MAGEEVGPKKGDFSETGETPMAEQEETTVGKTTSHDRIEHYCAEITFIVKYTSSSVLKHFISSLSGPTSELKAMIEKEVKEQMMLVSGQLDQQMKEIAGQHNRALASPQPNHRPKNNG